MTIHTDVADAISRHEITQKPLYRGSVYDFAEGLSDFAKGGQVAVSPATFGRLCLAGRRTTRASQALELALARDKQSALRRQNAGLKMTQRLFKCAA
jgi:hypothetical protein